MKDDIEREKWEFFKERYHDKIVAEGVSAVIFLGMCVVAAIVGGIIYWLK